MGFGGQWHDEVNVEYITYVPYAILLLYTVR